MMRRINWSILKSWRAARVVKGLRDVSSRTITASGTIIGWGTLILLGCGLKIVSMDPYRHNLGTIKVPIIFNFQGSGYKIVVM